MKFGKKIQREVDAMEPDWKQFVIPYKKLKKAIKYDEHISEEYNQWSPLLSNIWLEKLDKACEVTAQIIINNQQLDKDFYNLLLNSLLKLKTFLNEAFEDTQLRIDHLKEELLSVTNPFQKDIKIWKEIFALYKSSPLWDISSIHDLKNMDYNSMKDHYDTFVKKLLISKMAKKLTSSDSKEALVKLLETNQQILSLIKFCELNQTAAIKILKKFNKSTSIHLDKSLVKRDTSLLYVYPKQIKIEWFEVMNNTLPNIEDYFCPVCLEICWKPTRLECGHMFCHWCCIRSQVQRKRDCPLCRCTDAMRKVDERGTDLALSNYLKLYFPDEVKIKRKEQEKELMLSEVSNIRGGEFMVNNSCSIM